MRLPAPPRDNYWQVLLKQIRRLSLLACQAIHKRFSGVRLVAAALVTQASRRVQRVMHDATCLARPFLSAEQRMTRRDNQGPSVC